MAAEFESIDTALQAWLEAQSVFFVASAPLAGDGHVNCSPKGMDSFRVLGAREVAYLDLTGSGAETIAHVRENGRIVIMFCAFAGPPRIVRLHGRARVVLPPDAEWHALQARFPAHAGARAIVHVAVQRIGDSCGYAVPLMDLRGERDALTRWTQVRGEHGLVDYRRARNARSLDGLPALDPDGTQPER